MKEKKSAPMGFRPYQKNRERLEKAQKLGFEMGDVLNGLIDEYFETYLEKVAKARIQELQKSLGHR